MNGKRTHVLVWGLWLAALQAGCAQPAPATRPLAEPVEYIPLFDSKPRALAINGFNYTDLAIDSFSVGAAGGGNIFVSSPTSGGGGTSCCVLLVPGAALPRPISIEWMRNLDGTRRRCKKVVQLRGPIPNNPTALGVHFMPDGEVVVEVTEGEADPKLRLERFSAGQRNATKNVIHDEKKAVCRDDR